MARASGQADALGQARRMYLALQNIALGAFPQNDQIPVRKVIGYARERANQQIKPLMPLHPSNHQQPMTPGSLGWRLDVGRVGKAYIRTSISRGAQYTKQTKKKK